MLRMFALVALCLVATTSDAEARCRGKCRGPQAQQPIPSKPMVPAAPAAPKTTTIPGITPVFIDNSATFSIVGGCVNGSCPNASTTRRGSRR